MPQCTVIIFLSLLSTKPIISAAKPPRHLNDEHSSLRASEPTFDKNEYSRFYNSDFSNSGTDDNAATSSANSSGNRAPEVSVPEYSGSLRSKESKPHDLGNAISGKLELEYSENPTLGGSESKNFMNHLSEESNPQYSESFFRTKMFKLKYTDDDIESYRASSEGNGSGILLKDMKSQDQPHLQSYFVSTKPAMKTIPETQAWKMKVQSSKTVSGTQSLKVYSSLQSQKTDFGNQPLATDTDVHFLKGVQFSDVNSAIQGLKLNFSESEFLPQNNTSHSTRLSVEKSTKSGASPLANRPWHSHLNSLPQMPPSVASSSLKKPKTDHFKDSNKRSLSHTTSTRAFPTVMFPYINLGSIEGISVLALLTYLARILATMLRINRSGGRRRRSGVAPQAQVNQFIDLVFETIYD